MHSEHRVVIGVIGDDIHVVGQSHHAVGPGGVRVPGVQPPDAQSPRAILQAALETNAHAVFVSSLNGEGEYWCANFRKQFSDAGLGAVLLYVGGNIIVGKRPNGRSRRALQEFTVSTGCITSNPTSASRLPIYWRTSSMARPRPDARLPGIERTREQVLSHPLARGISPDEVRDFLAKVPRNRFPRVAYGKRGTARAFSRGAVFQRSRSSSG